MKRQKYLRALVCLLLAVYLLGVHDGKIALWCNDDPQPAAVFPYRAALLPEEVRKQLEVGIPIDSMDELNRLLEACLS